MKYSFFLLIFILACMESYAQTAADIEYHLSIEEPGIAIELLQQTDADQLGSDYYRFYTAAWLMKGELIEAQSKLEEGLRTYPENFYLKQMQSELYVQSGAMSQALELYRDLERLSERADPELHKQVRERLGRIFESLGREAASRNQFTEAARWFRKVTNYRPDEIAGWYNRALAHYNLQQYDDALDHIERALMIDPQHEQSREFRLVLLSQLQRSEKIIELLDEEIEENPQDLTPRLSRLRALLADGQPEEAQKYADELMDKFPDEPKLYDELAAINRRMGHSEGELNIIRKKRQAIPNDPNILLELSELHEMMNEWEKAIAKLDTLAKYNEFTEVAYTNKGRILELQQRPECAIKEYKRGLAAIPESKTLNRRLGWAQMDLELWEDAAETWKKLYQITEQTDDLLLWAEAEEQAFGIEKAWPLYSQMLQVENVPTRALFGSARYFAAKNELDKACTQKVDAIHTGYNEIKHQRAQLAQEMGQPGALLQKSRDIDRRPERLQATRSLVFGGFDFLLEQCSVQDAERTVKSLVEEFGNQGEILYFSAKKKFFFGNDEAALKDLESSISRMPELPEAHLLQARIHEKEENWREARQAWHRYHSLKPDSDRAYQGLISAYRQTEELDELVRRWQPQYMANPDNEKLRRYLREALYRLGMYDEAAKIGQQ